MANNKLSVSVSFFFVVDDRKLKIVYWSLISIIDVEFRLPCLTGGTDISYLWKGLLSLGVELFEHLELECGNRNRDDTICYWGAWSHWEVASEQALLGALAKGRRKEGVLEIKSLEFEYLHRKLKVDAKCRLAEMKSVMTSLPLAPVFQWLFTFAFFSVSW